MFDYIPGLLIGLLIYYAYRNDKRLKRLNELAIKHIDMVALESAVSSGESRSVEVDGRYVDYYISAIKSKYPNTQIKKTRVGNDVFLSVLNS